MLDLDRLRSIHLQSRPIVQKVLGLGFLGPAFRFPTRTHIIVEGSENFIAAPKVLGMNHTDRYNYWPLQYWLWRNKDHFTATWVKGKYFENRWIGKFMEMANNIPAPSKGYVMTRDFVSTVGRPPTDEEYRSLRELSNGNEAASENLPHPILTRSRDMLGRYFDSETESYAECISALLVEMNTRFHEINEDAFRKGLDLLIFPEGTRSIRLTQGRIGLVQAALRFKKGILPIGCNGSDKVYPGESPWARGGTITYRFGEYMPYESFSEFHLPDSVNPFSPELSEESREKMQMLTDRVMERINGLLDPEYQFDEEKRGSSTTGTGRFM